MDELRKAKNKDKILEYLYDERQFAMPVSDIAMALFQNAIDAKTVMDLCHEIIDFDPDLLAETMVGTKAAFQANDNTLYFMDNSSFVEMVEQGKRKEKVADIKQRERDKKQDEIHELQRKNLQLKTKTHWIPIIVSILGFIIALASFFKPSNEVSEPVDDSRLKDIETKIEQLENGLKKDLDSLQNELYEAQMLIKSYES